MSDPLRTFDRFTRQLRIPSKEGGLMPLRMWGTQRVFVDEIRKGLEEDIHWYVVLKFRQGGLSTISLALDAYWLMKHRGMQGQLVADKGDNLAYYRSLLDESLRSLPAKYAVPVSQHNRTQLLWANGSRLLYQVASKRKTDTSSGTGHLGRGRGLNYLHADEVSSYDDDSGFESLTSSIAQVHPLRLYLFISTARGYNLFYDLWENAKNAVTQRAIFIPWWTHEEFTRPETSPVFKVYWDGRPTGDELLWMKGVSRQYGHEITPGQLAWWRWQLAEYKKDSLPAMYEDYPPLPEYAFQATGSQFIGPAKLVQLQRLAKAAPKPQAFRYVFEDVFEKTQLHRTTPEHASLLVWEEPRPNGFYVIGADPAYGSSENSDRYAASVWRADGAGLRQVAEYTATAGAMYQFAWICAHLAGSYEATLNLEIDGPGQAVLQELLRLQSGWGITGPRPHLADVLGGIQHYIYRRPDVPTRSTLLHYKMGGGKKEPIMHNLRDVIERDALRVCSPGLVEELRSLRQEGSVIEAHGRAHDDRAIAAALAVEAWLSQILPRLEELGMAPSPDEPETVLERTVFGFLSKLREPEEVA